MITNKSNTPIETTSENFKKDRIAVLKEPLYEYIEKKQDEYHELKDRYSHEVMLFPESRSSRLYYEAYKSLWRTASQFQSEFRKIFDLKMNELQEFSALQTYILEWIKEYENDFHDLSKYSCTHREFGYFLNEAVKIMEKIKLDTNKPSS